MKTINKYAFCFSLVFLLAGCSVNETTSSSITSSSISNSDSSAISSSTSSNATAIPSKEEGVTLETFTEAVNKLEEQTNNKKIRISYHIVETLEGSVPNATFRNRDSLPEGQTVTDLVLESRNNSAGDLKVITGQSTTSFSGNFTSGIYITINDWLSYHKEKRNNAAREAMPGWNIFHESLKVTPFNMWMVYAGNRPANASVEGTYLSYEEYERTFDQNGYCQTLLYREHTYIDGTYTANNISHEEPKQYKGTFDAVATATIEYLD